MTVAALIEKLNKFPKDSVVAVDNYGDPSVVDEIYTINVYENKSGFLRHESDPVMFTNQKEVVYLT